jgi:RND family efflux transporter MFP subunit
MVISKPGEFSRLLAAPIGAFGEPFLAARRISRILGMGAVLFMAVACEEEPEVVEEIRSIKTFIVGEIATGQVLKFPGIVRSVNRTALSFEVPGNVLSVEVDIGDSVEKAQTLAKLDEEPYQLEVVKAESELVKAKANVKNKRANYEREKNVFDQGASSLKRLDMAEYGFREAEAGVEFAVSKLNLAERDLRKTVLYAPYDGTIGKRTVEPFVDVQRGQEVLEIDADGDKEVEVGIPETIVHLVTLDMPTLVSFPTLPGKVTDGRITQVGTVAGEGNAYPAKVRLLEPPDRVRSGMTAEVTFEFKDESLASGYLTPIHALLPTTEANRGHVFVYAADTSTVRKTPVHFRGVKENLVFITEGIAPGDVVAVAGVNFLSDGMKVKLMPEDLESEPEMLAVQ